MKFLVDNGVSPLVVQGLIDIGLDAVHVGEYKLHAAADSVILERAVDEDRVVITADTDFGELLAQNNLVKPSVILFRTVALKRAAQHLELLKKHLPDLKDSLQQGCIVILSDDQIRVRLLPLTDK